MRRTFVEHPNSCRFVPDRLGQPRSMAADGGGRMLTRKQHELLIFIDQHLRADRLLPLLRGDEGRAEAEVEVRHPPADHRARGARLPPPPRASGPGAGGDAPAGERGPSPRARHAAGRRGRAGRQFPAQRHPRRFHAEARPACRAPTRPRRCICRSMAASPPACRSRRCATAAAASRCRRPCSASGEHYALEVAGDSMVEAGILDGDTVIIRGANRPRTARSSSPWWMRTKSR